MNSMFFSVWAQHVSDIRSTSNKLLKKNILKLTGPSQDKDTDLRLFVFVLPSNLYRVQQEAKDRHPPPCLANHMILMIHVQLTRHSYHPTQGRAPVSHCHFTYSTNLIRQTVTKKKKKDLLLSHKWILRPIPQFLFGFDAVRDKRLCLWLHIFCPVAGKRKTNLRFVSCYNLK